MSRIWKAILWLFVVVSAERTRGQFQDAESKFANMKIKSVEKVKVEAISKAEAIRMRQTGLRFHEVEHHHFNDKNSRNGKLWQDLKDAAAAAGTEKESLPGFPWKKKKKKGEDTKEEKSSTSTKAKTKETSSEEEEVTNSSQLDTSLEEALMPQRKIRPTRVGGFLCAQFDLDLFALSGGAFPGMVGVGLLGDIHYQPTTHCYGWTAEMYLMFSIGVGLWGMDFRVALVVITTLVVTERPLSAGAKDLVWELPPGFDTAHCMQSNPFKLITATTTEGWKFIYHHVLKKRYLKHAENEVKRYLIENKHEIAGFQRYMDFIEPPQALPETITSPTQSRGLASTGIVASVEIKGRWQKGFIELEVIMPKEQRVTSSGVSGSIFEFVSEVRAKIWQEIGQVVLSQKSGRCDWPKYDNFRCKFRFNARRQAMAYAQISFHTFQDFVVPVQIDSSDDEFSFPASVRVAREPLAGTLSCQSLKVQALAKDGKKCATVESLFVQVQVGQVFEEATWYNAEFGEGSPWGIDISKDGLHGDHREIDELLAEKMARTGLEPANIRLYEFDNKAALEFLSQLRHANEDWCKQQDTFRHDIWLSLAKPTKSAADVLHMEALVEVLQKMIIHLQAYYHQKMKQQQEVVLVPTELSKSLEVPVEMEKILHQLKSKFSNFVEDCATQAVVYALREFSQDADKGAFLSNLEVCRLVTTKKESVTDISMLRPKQNKASEGERIWKTFENRSVNTRSCTEEGMVSAGSAQSCQRFCDEDSARDPSDQRCNTVVYESAGDEVGWCTLWFCHHWDTFPRDEGKVLSVKLDEKEDRSPTLLEVFLAAPDNELRHAVGDILKHNLKEMVEDLLIDEKMTAIWRNQVRSLWPDDMMWPKRGVLVEGIWRPLLAECLVEDGTWVSAQRTMTLSRGLTGLDNGFTMRMTWAKGGQQVTQRHEFKNDFKGPSRKWSEYVTINEPDGGCSVEVESQWIWQVPGSSAYFVRPNMVPARALFASYDQFISKFPAYAEQVVQRITPKNKSAWKISVLPYKTTDGRHLHRHLKKGEQDRVKVHKGEMATDDAVYNFPRAMAESKHRKEPNFLYNAGLSAANLFLRVLSDVQAMFNIYFANHPDWDQSCESLPARFNVLFESEKVRRETSNWRDLKLLRFKKKSEKMKITHRAKDKVSQRGEELSKDDLAMIEDWHWVSKPRWYVPMKWVGKERWYFSSDTRADFFTQTPPVHGKDGWATADVSDLDAVMWPHVWCELVEQEWNSMSTELPQQEGEDETSWKDSLVELYHKIPEPVKPLMQKYSLDSLGEFLLEMLPGFPEAGCPERMKVKEVKAVDYATFALLAAWDNSITVMGNSLNFFQMLVEKLIAKEDELQISGDEELGSDENSSEVAVVPPEGNPKVTRISQLDTIMDTISTAIEKWRTHGTMGSGLRDSLMQSWDALFKNLTEAETSSTVEARRSFQESRDTLEALVLAQKTRVSEIGDHLERLFNEENSADEAAHKAEISAEIKEHAALQYVRVLVQAASQRQTEVLGNFNRISSCIDSISKPKLLPDTVFGWTEGYTAGSAGRPKLSVEELRKRMNANRLHTGQGLELFFDKACRVSPETNFKIPEHLRLDTLSEPRSECERVVLSNAFLTMFPNFANAILFTFWRITFKLARLSKDPTKAMVDEILKVLYLFLRKVQQGGKNFYLDDDFYKAFGYRKDGSLFGKLWSNLPSALTEIAATLQTRKDTRTQWITESIAFRSKLKSARRMRVRELENDKKTIATEVEGCICQEQWTAYKWRKLMPQLETFSGCVENSDQQSLKFVKNSSGWKGFCKTKRDLYSAVTTQCGVKFAECDPEAESKKPKFQIWRSADVLRAEPVRLPLLQLDLYLHIDLRNRRADFCTPNFAPLMLDSNTHWSMSNWLPYDLRRSGCFGARIHPPGFSLQLTRCRHRALGSSKKVTTEWSMTGVAYLVSHYNVWGTGDGDMTRTWFGGGENWGAAAASQGWPNFLMADPGTWFSSAAGSGYLSTPSVAASPSAFWFGLLAEVISTLSMAEFLSPKNASSKMHTAKTAMTTAVVVIWRLLQKYAVVPNSWSAFMGTSSVLKSLGAKGLLKATGFRNEHDVVLSLKYATNFARRRLDLASLINDMSMDQLREIFFAAKVLGAPVDQLWVNHTSTAAGAPSVVRNMHREMLIDLARSYMQNVKTTHRSGGGFLSSEQSQKQLQELFRRCDGRPLWYKVVDRKSRPLYSFWKRESSAWVQPKLVAGKVLMISKYDDDWYTVIDETHLETRYIPARYLKETAMVLAADVIDSHSAGSQQIPTRVLLDFEIEQVLQQVSVETLECWGNHISSAKPEMFKRIMMEANRKEKKMTPSIFDSSGQLLEGTEVPLGYFSLPYVRTFMSDNFGNFLSSMNTSKQESFLKIFGRGKKSRVKLKAQKQSQIVSLMRSSLRPGRRGAIFAKEAPSDFKPERQCEISSSKTSYYDVGLSILTRLGFSFIKLPGIFQLQPYLQLSVQYDVKEILRVFKAKVRPGHESSKVQQYLRRKRTCEHCIEMNLAFCDRQEAADAMLKKGHTMEMDACEPMDLQSKEMCHRFALPEGTHLAKTLRGDGLFKKEVCPCYRPVSGTQIVPRWITTKASCADISWPDAEVEALKRASKDRDWSSGFSMQSQNVRFGLDEMDEFNSEPPKQKGCLEGYRCCAIFQDSKKPSKVRCVESKSLFKKSSWIHPTSKCKYFKPKDLKGSWTHAEQHCAADDVDGYWSWNKEANEWHEESAPVQEVPTEAEALMGQDDSMDDDIMDDDEDEELV